MLKDLVLRIGSLDYEPSPQVKPHTLDTKFNEAMNSQYLIDTKNKIASASELISILQR
jgi:hypothetical protein